MVQQLEIKLREIREEITENSNIRNYNGIQALNQYKENLWKINENYGF